MIRTRPNPMSEKKLAAYQAEHGRKPFSSITGKRKAVRKVSAKQREILKRLAAIRLEWWNEQEELICHICTLRIVAFADLNSDHVIPGKMGGCKDHSRKNLKPAHWWCNRDKGSRRDFKILSNKT